MTKSLADLLVQGRYLSYAYSYPHKTAYRPLTPAVNLREAWANENRSALFLYLHVPFCEQRCGYCNLFSMARPSRDTMLAYVDALERQASAMARVLAPARFARLAIGGGTPGALGVELLSRLFELAAQLGAEDLPISVELSPGTARPEILRLLETHRVTRVSLGVQSVVDDELTAIHRQQSLSDIERTMSAVSGFPTRNVDLIYGLPEQTELSFCHSIERVVSLGASELYLYPLYVREHTGLAGRTPNPDHRVALYRAGRSHLLERGFVQQSMRLFRRSGSVEPGAPSYRCQTDGMVGLGIGARSYTRALHYASPYAITEPRVQSALDNWIGQSEGDFVLASHGFQLVQDEQRRRYLMLSLLEGSLERDAYAGEFGADVLTHFPELREAIAADLVAEQPTALTLTELGLECSDVLGAWLESPTVRGLRAGWERG